MMGVRVASAALTADMVDFSRHLILTAAMKMAAKYKIAPSNAVTLLVPVLFGFLAKSGPTTWAELAEADIEMVRYFNETENLAHEAALAQRREAAAAAFDFETMQFASSKERLQ